MNLAQKIKDLVIHHLGGCNVSSHDVAGIWTKLNRDDYFFEGVPVKTDNGEIFIYGNVLKPYVDEWMSKVEAEEVKGCFQEFLADKMSKNPKVRSNILNQQVRYFDDDDRKKTEVKVENGRLMQIGLDDSSPEFKPLISANYAFVIIDLKDENEKINRKLYAAPKVKTKKGKIQHSSFARGGNVISAGTLEISAAQQIIRVHNTSGHYRPTSKEIAYLIKHLVEAGFDISQLEVTCSTGLLSWLDRLSFGWGGLANQRADRWYDEAQKAIPLT